MARKKTEEEILEIAKGNAPADLEPTKFWSVAPEKNKDFLVYRREARRTIYKILKKRKAKCPIEDAAQIELFNILDPQIQPNFGLNWESFTQKWDLHPKDVTKIILKEQWIKEGGGFDAELGTHHPIAFTNQTKE